MNNKVKKTYLIFCILAVMALIPGFVTALSAQTLLPDRDRRALADSIAARATDWETVNISGKLKMKGLPVTPGVRIFMKRDSVVLISLRAPLLGEVGRAEIADSTILMVNKMNKTYVEEPLSKALDYYPGGISDVQDLILGNMVIPGFGNLSPDTEEMVEIYHEDDDTFTVVASEEAALPGFNYGYVLDSALNTGALMVLPLSRPDVSVTLTYEYFENGYDLAFYYQSEKRNHTATLELDLPEWGGSGFDRIRLNSKFTRLTFDKFMKSF